MADDLLSGLSSADQIASNHEKYKDKFKDAASELVNSETFLNLLVAEMTNQDPLEPTSNTEFIGQLATFSSLQYMKDASTYSMANYASSLVGKIATGSKMDGANLVVETGVVESVTKEGDSYTVKINGQVFDLSKITGVTEKTDDTASGVKDSLGDSISRAAMMVGMYATVNGQAQNGTVLDAGIIQSIQVKDGQISAVINGTAYPLSQIVEVTYAVGGGEGTEEGTEQNPAVSDTDGEEDIADLVEDETGELVETEEA